MAWLLNMVLPGTGLILRGREGVGFLICLVFGLCGQVALAGMLIAPEAIPAWLVWVASVLAALTWAGAQMLLAARRHR